MSQIDFEKLHIPPLGWKENPNIMSVQKVIEEATAICQNNGVEHLALFGSFAKGLSRPTSDLDFVIYGCKDLLSLEEQIQEKILTVRPVNFLEFATIRNPELKEDIEQYAIQIY